MKTQFRSKKIVPSDQIIYYLIVLAVALGLKYHYSRAGSDDLEWILKPAAGLCQFITSVEFEHESGSGYINREYRVIIAPSCAGVNFMIAAFVLAAATGFRHFKTARLKMFWLIGSLVQAYLATIMANTFRIIAAIYTINANFGYVWLNHERIHRFQGIIIYFLSLILFYVLTQKIASYQSNIKPASDRHVANSWAPFLTYSAIVSGIPILNLAWKNDPCRFWEHLFTVSTVSLFISILLYFVQWGCRSFDIGVKKELLSSKTPQMNRY